MNKDNINIEIGNRITSAVSYIMSLKGFRRQTEVAKLIGRDETNISKAKKGNLSYTDTYIDAICATFPEFSKVWLLTGKGEMVSNRSDAKYVAPYIGENLIKIPYVSVDAAASFVESLYEMEYDIDTFGVMPENGEILDDGSYMVFQVRGNSMEPTIPDHAKILTKKIDEGQWESASGVIVIVYGKTLSVKRILKNSLFCNNTLTIKADNPIHGQVDVVRNEIRGMWQAVRIVSQRIL